MNHDHGILSSLACLVLAGTALHAQESDAAEAAELLRKAEEQVAKGHYDRAVSTYRKLAETYPETPAGSVGAERSRPTAYLGSQVIIDNGPSSNRVDVALMGDGYTLEHQRAFDELAEDVPRLFERVEPLTEYLSYFNFRRFNLVSKDDNVDGYGREMDTALGGRTLSTIQGHVGVDPRAVHAMLDQVEEHDDLAMVFVRAGTFGTGAPGIAAVGGRDARTTVHEWGHAFARLGDEYPDRTADRGGVMERPNVSATDDEDEVPWAHWLDARVPGIGIYEGANGQVRGAWKPTPSGCVMDLGDIFCPPCREALVLRIYSLVDPIDRTNHPPYPFEHPASLEIEDEFEFEVDVMTPASHVLEVRWWIFTEDDAPQEPRGIDERYAPGGRRFGDRRDRGLLAPIDAKPDQFSRVNKSGEHTFKVKARKLDPGRYRVVCRVVDTTELRGEKRPWVLRDEHGLLESERAWWITIP